MFLRTLLTAAVPCTPQVLSKWGPPMQHARPAGCGEAPKLSENPQVQAGQTDTQMPDMGEVMTCISDCRRHGVHRASQVSLQHAYHQVWPSKSLITWRIHFWDYLIPLWCQVRTASLQGSWKQRGTHSIQQLISHGMQDEHVCRLLSKRPSRPRASLCHEGEEMRGELGPECTVLVTVAQCLAHCRAEQPIHLLHGDVNATGQGPGLRCEWGWAGGNREAELAGWGAPYVGEAGFPRDQTARSTFQPEVRKTAWIKDEATKVLTHRTCVSEMRMEPGARMGFASQPWWSGALNIHGLISPLIPHPLTMVVYREAMPRTWTGGGKSEDLAWVPVLCLSYSWGSTSLGIYKMSIPIFPISTMIIKRGPVCKP